MLLAQFFLRSVRYILKLGLWQPFSWAALCRFGRKNISFHFWPSTDISNRYKHLTSVSINECIILRDLFEIDNDKAVRIENTSNWYTSEFWHINKKKESHYESRYSGIMGTIVKEGPALPR